MVETGIEVNILFQLLLLPLFSTLLTLLFLLLLRFQCFFLLFAFIRFAIQWGIHHKRVIKSRALSAGGFRHDLNLLAELLCLECVVLFIRRVPAECSLALLLLVLALEPFASNLEFEII